MAVKCYAIREGPRLSTAAVIDEVRATVRRIIFFEQQDAWTDLACQELVTALQQLLKLIELSFSLEETYGYFEDSVFDEAGYGDRVSEMREEHEDLSAELSRLCDDASRLLKTDGFPYCADAIMARFYAFCDQLAAHELREKELISEALSIDIGCLD